MHSSSEYRSVLKLKEILESKIGDPIGILKTGGTFTSGYVASVKEDILALAASITRVQGQGIFAAVAFIPLIDITTILDDLDPELLNTENR
ncbi:hypothetical protein [Halobacillus sp. K22]|uniref:hypothetical protein n=1 Tax=Halobacillus sp. K22 TaxID=3457431 RepID=UPI003FCCD40C